MWSCEVTPHKPSKKLIENTQQISWVSKKKIHIISRDKLKVWSEKNKNAAWFNTQNNLSVHWMFTVNTQVSRKIFFFLSSLTSLAISLLTNKMFLNFFMEKKCFIRHPDHSCTAENQRLEMQENKHLKHFGDLLSFLILPYFYIGSKCTNGSTLSISKLFFNWQ